MAWRGVATAAAAEAEDPLDFVISFPPGCLVKVTGLVRCTQYNGLMGVVAKPPQDETTKHEVCLIREKGPVRIRRKNLRCATENSNISSHFLELWPFDINKVDSKWELPVSSVFGGAPDLKHCGKNEIVRMKRFFCSPDIKSLRPRWLDLSQSDLPGRSGGDMEVIWRVWYDPADRKSELNQFANIFCPSSDRGLIRGNVVIAEVTANNNFQCISVEKGQRMIWRCVEFLSYGTVVSLSLQGLCKWGLVTKNQAESSPECWVNLHGNLKSTSIERKSLLFVTAPDESFALETWSFDREKIRVKSEIPVSQVFGAPHKLFDGKIADDPSGAVIEFLMNPKAFDSCSTRDSWNFLVWCCLSAKDKSDQTYLYFNDEETYEKVLKMELRKRDQKNLIQFKKEMQKFMKKFSKGMGSSMVVCRDIYKSVNGGAPVSHLVPVSHSEIRKVVWTLETELSLLSLREYRGIQGGVIEARKYALLPCYTAGNERNKIRT